MPGDKSIRNMKASVEKGSNVQKERGVQKETGSSKGTALSKHVNSKRSFGEVEGGSDRGGRSIGARTPDVDRYSNTGRGVEGNMNRDRFTGEMDDSQEPTTGRTTHVGRKGGSNHSDKSSREPHS